MPHLLQVRLKKAAGSSSGDQMVPSLAFKVLVDVDDLGAEIAINDELSIHVLAHGPTQVVRVSAAVRDGAGRVGRETLDDTAKIEKIMVNLVSRSSCHPCVCNDMYQGLTTCARTFAHTCTDKIFTYCLGARRTTRKTVAHAEPSGSGLVRSGWGNE